MTAARIGRILLGVLIVTTVAIVAMVDVFNQHHLVDPDWSAHARLRNAMQAVMLVLVSAASLAALIFPPSKPMQPGPDQIGPGPSETQRAVMPSGTKDRRSSPGKTNDIR
ncbi:MAG: hypothetical protein ACFB6S_08420 [Geminicoccaceae bacterium]